MSSIFFFAENQVLIYCGIPVLITGVLGGILNALVFLSLRTFRQSSCAFYLTIMSIINIGQLFIGLFSRILIVISTTDAAEATPSYCKSRAFFSHMCNGITLTCFCMATIDQYFATCSNVRLQQLCNIKLARYVMIINVIFWILHAIPYALFYENVRLNSTNQLTCKSTNNQFERYRTLFVLPILLGYLPIVSTAIFGLMALQNVKNMAYRIVPLVRRELEKQLTFMVLVQVAVNIFTLIPFTTITAIVTNVNLTTDSIIQAKLQLTVTVTLVIYFIYYASPFYIYICASERFRKQLIYVLFKIHHQRWKRPRIVVNQIIPEI